MRRGGGGDGTGKDLEGEWRGEGTSVPVETPSASGSDMQTALL